MAVSQWIVVPQTPGSVPDFSSVVIADLILLLACWLSHQSLGFISKISVVYCWLSACYLLSVFIGQLVIVLWFLGLPIWVCGFVALLTLVLLLSLVNFIGERLDVYLSQPEPRALIELPALSPVVFVPEVKSARFLID